MGHAPVAGGSTSDAWLGALLTVLSGIYIVYREQREQTAASRGRASSVAVNVREDART